MGSYRSVKWLEGLSPEQLRKLTAKMKEKREVKHKQKIADENFALLGAKWRGQEIHKLICKELKGIDY